MEQTRRDLFADAGRSGNQHPAAGCRDFLQRCPHSVYGRRRSVQLLGMAYLCAQRCIFRAQPFGFSGFRHQMKQTYPASKGFSIKSTAPCAIAATAVSILPWPENTMTGICGSRLFDRFEQFYAVHRGTAKPDIEQNQRWQAFVERRQRLVRGGRRPRPVAVVLEHPGHKVTDVLFVINDKYVQRHIANICPYHAGLLLAPCEPTFAATISGEESDRNNSTAAGCIGKGDCGKMLFNYLFHDGEAQSRAGSARCHIRLDNTFAILRQAGPVIGDGQR